MKYKAVLHHDEEGYAVSVPALPGCHSQGETERRALENIADAIREFVAVLNERHQNGLVREVEVEV
ncbi:MAG TPA: type II toxin-antitoxin system HicB family antitoxin [Gemmataceae bacterium]